MNGSKARIDNEKIKTYKHYCKTNYASKLNFAIFLVLDIIFKFSCVIYIPW